MSWTKSTRLDVQRRDESNPKQTARGRINEFQTFELWCEGRCGTELRVEWRFLSSTFQSRERTVDQREVCGEEVCEEQLLRRRRSVADNRFYCLPPSVHFILTPCHSGSGAEKDNVGLRLYQAALVGNLVAMAAALAEGAEVNGSIGEEAGRTALIGAAVGVKHRIIDNFI